MYMYMYFGRSLLFSNIKVKFLKQHFTTTNYYSPLMTREGALLLLDPFHGGSHKQLSDLLYDRNEGCVRVTMTPKKWMWRARTSALWLSENIPYSQSYRILFSSGVLNLAELVALRPDLGKLKKILYFHENQLVYPVRKQKNRDFQYGYNQILSCLVADVVVFNSVYNKDSFLSSINSHLKLMPDYKPKNLADKIAPKCRVIYFPLNLPVKDIKVKQIEQNLKPCEEDCINDSKHQVKKFKISSDCNMINDEDDSFNKADINKMDTEEQASEISKSNQKLEHSLHDQCSGCLTESESNVLNNINVDQNLLKGDKSASFVSSGLQCGQVSVKGDDSDCVLKSSSQELEGDQVLDKGDNCVSGTSSTTDVARPLHIVWAHRWEHDKDPDSFFSVMFDLFDAGVTFNLSVMGENFTDNPEIFETARQKLSPCIVHWGYQANKEDYYDALKSADVAISTALHEFFGVAMMEATYYGCYPLCPNRLVYPEIFPKCYLYNTQTQLLKRLKSFCLRPSLVRKHVIQVQVEKYLWESSYKSFQDLLTIDGQET